MICIKIRCCIKNGCLECSFLRVTLVVDIRDPNLKTKDPKKDRPGFSRIQGALDLGRKKEIATGPTTLPQGDDSGTAVPVDALSQNLRSLSSPAEVLPATSIVDGHDALPRLGFGITPILLLMLW